MAALAGNLAVHGGDDGADDAAVVGLRGEVWLAERLRAAGGDDGQAAQFRRRMLGDFELPSANIPMHVEFLEVDGETFVVAGVLKQTQRAVKIWHLDKAPRVEAADGRATADAVEFVGGFRPHEIELERPRDGKLRGFGCIVPLPRTERNAAEKGAFRFRIGCGLGIGKAHIWDLQVDLAARRATQQHIGSVMGRRNSISAMCLSGSKIVTVAALDELIQVWDIRDLLSGGDSAQSTDKEAASEQQQQQPFNASSKLGAVQTADALAQQLPELAVARLRAEHASFNAAQAKVLADSLFKVEPEPSPLWLLAVPAEAMLSLLCEEGEASSSAKASKAAALLEALGDYEGDLDSERRPHGTGWRSVPTPETSSSAEEDLSYQGSWVRGHREGMGVLRNEVTGQVIYKGHWREDRQDGFGQESLRAEEFQGNFRAGARHGFGVLRLTKAQRPAPTKTPGRLERARESRCSREAGESYAGCWRDGKMHGIGRWVFPPRCKSLNAESPDALLPLGKIGCIVAHKQDRLLRELLFHRVDGEQLSVDDRSLIECGTSKSRNAAFTLPGAFAEDPAGRWHSCEACWVCMENLGPEALECPTCLFRVHAQTCAAFACESEPEASATKCPNPSCQGAQLAPISEKALASDFEDWVRRHKPQTKRPKTTPSALDVRGAAPQKRPEYVTPSASASQTRRHGPQKRASPEPSADPERQNGATMARKLARKLKKERMKLHTDYHKATLGGHRRSEVQQRKQWSAQLREKQAHLSTLVGQLDCEQGVHQSSQLELNRFNGRDLKAMRLSELTSLQDAVEEALQSCRIAMETTSTTAFPATTAPSSSTTA